VVEEFYALKIIFIVLEKTTPNNLTYNCNNWLWSYL